MGKALSSELSCTGTGLVYIMAKHVSRLAPVHLFVIAHYCYYYYYLSFAECLFKKMNPAFVHYLEWLSSLSVLTIVFLIGKFLDNIMVTWFWGFIRIL